MQRAPVMRDVRQHDEHTATLRARKRFISTPQRAKVHVTKIAAAVLLCVASFAVHAVPVAVLNADVTSTSLNRTICVSGYTKTVRPSTSFTNAMKKRLMLADGLDYDTERANYELDHIIPLALGGHPRNPQNLVLQDWEGDDGAKRKDRLEVKLQCLVCSGELPLEIAQDIIWKDWKTADTKYGALACHRPRGIQSRQSSMKLKERPDVRLF